jgi:hypothetical protein
MRARQVVQSRVGNRSSSGASLVGAAGRALAGAALVGAGGAGSGVAAPANVTIVTGQVVYNAIDLNRPGGSQYEDYISYADCMRNKWSVDVPVKVTTSAGALELWAAEGDRCATDLSRSRSGLCRRLPLLLSETGAYRVPVQAIMDALGIRDCTDDLGQTGVRTVNLNFLLAGSAEDSPGTIDATNDATLPVYVQLVGPRAPGVVGVNPEDGMLELDLSAGVDPNTLGFYVFLDPNPKPAQETPGNGPPCAEGTGGPGGGASGRASSSSGAGGASPSSCPPGATLPCVDRERPSASSTARYDTPVSSTTSSVLIEGLDNDRPYTLAIAGYDAVGNVGPLSALLCGTPRSTDTFFKRYCMDGGTACIGGCGSCRVGTGAELAWPSLCAAAVATLGLALRRRTRSR